ncbi:DUF3221 domain-containing protein [Bacillus safensis]|uniref:DUF3221 domain-containing protein n=1 Tax=Bacillus safensis TaxID=561879 RepID=UPI0037F3337E
MGLWKSEFTIIIIGTTLNSNDFLCSDLTKVDSKELSQGQTIEVWFDELQESFPPKATVKKYHIMMDK